jgi:chemotaxis protein MotB
MYRPRFRNQLMDRREESEHLDRWLVSYADYMTLMFALFVVLYALAIIKEEQYDVLSDTLGKVFVVEGDDGAGVTGEGILLNNDPVDTELQLYGTSLLEVKGPELLDGKEAISNITQQRLGHPLESLEQQLKNALFDLIDKGYAEVEADDDWLTIELNSGLLFVSGSASTTNSAQLVLKQIYTIIGASDNYIRVRGYTDDQPINTELYQSNWHLSVARATAVLAILEQLKVNPARMAIEGYGQYSPSADNSTAQGRSNNRKVVIALSKYALQQPKIGLDDPAPVSAEQKKPIKKQKTGDYEQVQVIELPSGGIRITTRRDDNDKQ